MHLVPLLARSLPLMLPAASRVRVGEAQPGASRSASGRLRVDYLDPVGSEAPTGQDGFVESKADSIRISVLGSDGEIALRSLLDWLHHEEGLRGHVELEQAAPRPGEMGVMADGLVVALGSGGAGAVLAGALATWIRQQRSDFKLTIRAKGRTVELDAKRVPDAQALLREFGSLLGREEIEQ